MLIAGQLDASTYDRAEALLPENRSRVVAAGKVRPHWLDGGARFWYRVDGPDGHRFVVVNPAAGTRESAFDHERLAKALAEATGVPADAASLPFRAIDLKNDAVEFFAIDGYWHCALDSYACERVEAFAPPNPLEVTSPDSRWVVFRRADDLWLRSTETGEERALTSDGVEDYAYGVQSDSLSFAALFAKLGLPHLPPIVAWSPDSKRVLTHRTDQRGVRLQHLVEAAPAAGDRPALHTYHYAMPGDEVPPRCELLVIDIETRQLTAKTAPLLMTQGSPLMMMRAWWAADGSAIYYLEAPREPRTVWLKRLDALTGESRTMVEESDAPWVDANQVPGGPPIGRVLSDDEVLWWSQRDGWGHLYLYDGQSGELRNRVTSGDWIVQQVVHVDEEERVVYFLASGLVEADPYRRQFCRVDLDGSSFARLTDDHLDHVITVSPNSAYVLDSASAVDTPPVITVLGWDGAVIVELERTDITRLLETGWTPPEPFHVKADDGETDIFGLLYRPVDFDPASSYPVIDHPYPGPHMARVLPSFQQGPTWDPESVAALGFVVIALNGRGTPGRNKAFHDWNYQHLGDVGLADHVAAIRQLAETRPWMDLERVGIYGHSRGGGRVVRAMCEFPDFYKVGVAKSGAHDLGCYHLGIIEACDGPFAPDVYAGSSNLEIADRLEGKLLLIHGGMDDNTHPHQTLRLVERLIAANKDFELLIVPEAEHLFIGYEWYVRRRRWDFLVRNLLGVEPPSGYRLAQAELDFEKFGEMLG
jgi:dipeptidyl-peptidase 4